DDPHHRPVRAPRARGGAPADALPSPDPPGVGGRAGRVRQTGAHPVARSPAPAPDTRTTRAPRPAPAPAAREPRDRHARPAVRRILLPFLLAWPLVWWSMSASTGWAAASVQHPSPLLLMIREWMQQPDPPRLPPGTAHLWFLYYLLLFAVLHWVLRTLELGRFGQRLLRQHPAWVLLGLPLLVLPALASVSAPHPAPESMVPQFWAITFYGTFFALGALLHGQPDWIGRVRPLARWLLAAAILAYLTFLWRLAVDPPGPDQPVAPLATAALEACLSVWLTIGCLLAGQRLLDRANPVMRYFAQGAYWTYLLHLPLLFAIQYLLLD